MDCTAKTWSLIQGKQAAEQDVLDETYVFILYLKCQQPSFSIYEPLLAPENCEQEEVGELKGVKLKTARTFVICCFKCDVQC